MAALDDAVELDGTGFGVKASGFGRSNALQHALQHLLAMALAPLQAGHAAHAGPGSPIEADGDAIEARSFELLGSAAVKQRAIGGQGHLLQLMQRVVAAVAALLNRQQQLIQFRGE